MTSPSDPSHPENPTDPARGDDPSTQRIPQTPQPQAWSQTRPFETTAHPYAGDPAPGDTPDDRPPRRRRRVGVIVGVSTLVVVLVLVIAGVGSELYLRNAAKDCLARSFSDLTGTSASVSLSKEPMLYQYFSGTVPYVQVDSGSNDGRSIALRGRAENITSRSDGSTLGSLDATGTVPFDRIVALGQQGTQQQGQSGGDSSGVSGLFGGVTLSRVTGNPSTGTITLDASVQVAIFPVPVSAEIKPVVSNGKLTFQVVKASALVFGVPASFAQDIVDGVSKTLFPPLFDQLRFEKLTVTAQGVDFAVRGSDVVLDQQSLGGGGNTQSQQSTCSVL